MSISHDWEKPTSRSHSASSSSNLCCVDALATDLSLDFVLKTLRDDVVTSEFNVDRRDRLEPDEFSQTYVRQGRPVLLRRVLQGCTALSRWTFDFLRTHVGCKLVPLKEWGPSGIQTVSRRFDTYIDNIKLFEWQLRSGEASEEQKPAYLHDLPLTSILPDAKSDLENFPSDYFPAWYGAEWWQFAQIFIGPIHSITPLHFDCLLTHNLFFQIKGRKRFILIAAKDLKYCYPHHWRWCDVDVEAPDYEHHPLYRKAKPTAIIVEPGDGLYLPPGTLHHVRSLDCALSFNVDWHTRGSALKGVLGCLRGMPWINVYYNTVVALGLCGGISQKRIFPYYRSYLNYVS